MTDWIMLSILIFKLQVDIVLVIYLLRKYRLNKEGK